MKLNRKGYMLVEMILAATIAMAIAYYLLNLTYKFKDKNEDIYNTTALVTDKILITKNIMNDLEGKIVELNSRTDNEIVFTANGEQRKITIDDKTIKYINQNNNIIYKKTLANSMEIGKINFENNVVSIPITSIYSDNTTEIKIFIKDNSTTTFYYTGNVQEYTVPKDGYYLIELWGAQGGGSSPCAQGGKGGYTRGYINLNKGEKLYIYVGSQATFIDGTYTNGYNGGGSGGTDKQHITLGGGGATDIRYFNGTPSQSDLAWDSNKGLNSRIMVAGGGGGSYNYNNNPHFCKNGGAGGGLIAAAVMATNEFTATGGTQTIGGIGNNGRTEYSGSFGKGGNGAGATYLGTGGGGGYYGGGGTYNIGSSAESGGGGSSFISGYAGVNAKKSDGTHSDNTLHYSNKYFIDGKMEAGNREGNGQAKITYMGNEIKKKDSNKLNNVRYIKDCTNGNSSNNGNHWVEIQAIQDGLNIAKGKTVTGTSPQNNNSTHAYSNIVDGKIDNTTGTSGFGYPNTQGNQCVTVDLGKIYDLDEVVVWHYFSESRYYKENIASVSSDNSDWKYIIDDRYSSNILEKNTGKRVSAYS